MIMRHIGFALLAFSLIIGSGVGAEESIYNVQVDIKSIPQGKEVIFIVAEKPSIKEILVKGNNKVKLDDIKEKITLKIRSILNLEKVKEDSEQIRKLYFSKGYYGVKVEYKVDYLETNEAVVTFTISEGPKGRIQKIVFKGNKKIKSSRLKKVMTTKQGNIFSFITQTGTLDEDVLKNDLQLLSAYYFDQGYLEAKISEPKVDFSKPKKIRIEIEITEGPQYHIGNIDFKGDVLTTKEALFKVLKIKRGDIYSNSAIRREINGLTGAFADQGYAFVEINPETSVDNKNLLVHLTFEIEKKRTVHYERIQIVGNTKTRDKVIRRELKVAEGELYGAGKMNKSRDRLKRTGYFKEVEFTTSRGSTEEKINLDIKVEEAPTGAVTFGIGYSSLESLVGSASVSDRNLFGLGYHGMLRFSLGAETQNFKLSFTDPYFLGYPFSGGIDLYHERVETFDTYAYQTTGGALRFGKELTEQSRVDLSYKLENINVYDIDELVASDYIKEQKGRRLTSAISLTPSIDTRDDYYNPRRGGVHSLFVQNAGGILGGDNYFVKVLGKTSWFFPLPLNSALNLRGQAGVVMPYGGKVTVRINDPVYDSDGNLTGYTERILEKDRLPIYEKFFVGGITTMRGFRYGMAGPIDKNEEPQGAKKMVVFNAELIFPLSREIGLRGAFFFDVGKGFDTWKGKTSRSIDTSGSTPVMNRKLGLFPLRFAAGPGIRWFSPFGPIHIDIGFNLDPRKGEKRHVIDFTAGTVY